MNTRRSIHPIRHSIMQLFSLALCLLCMAATSLAQGTNLGTIRGTVTDNAGAVVNGAKVQVVDLATDIVREVTTNSEGNYEVAGLKFGSYRVAVAAQGFKTSTINQVNLRGSDIVRTDVTLQVGGAAETV